MRAPRFLLGAATLLFSFPAWTQPAPPVISLITILPGVPIYSAFGHTALRVQDSESGADLIYDFGQSQVPFNAAFVPLFLMGDMPFMAAVVNTDRAFEFWRSVERRTVLEQRIDLSPGQARELQARLEYHALPANSGYIYDFLYDNCATRVRDVLEEVLGEPLGLPRQPQTVLTFREELQPYLKDSPILELGIMLILGPKADAVPTEWEVLFLPARLMEAFGEAVVVFEGAQSDRAPRRASVSFLTWALLGAALLTSYVRKTPRIAAQLLDSILYAASGLLGIVMVALWMFSGYEPTYWNLNLLWAWPLHVLVPLVGLQLSRQKRLSRIFRGYLWATSVFSVLFVLSMPLLAQDIPAAIVPIILALGVRAAARALSVSDHSRASLTVVPDRLMH